MDRLYDIRDVAAILLAGGVGSRLNILVKFRAKPAVPFGGIYRIIDFTLSNIANSGLTRVAILTQYKPLSLMRHIGDGAAWDLSGRKRNVKILPPKTGEKDWDWYKGTADAVRQNISFIESYEECNDVLILSGDHVYYMDYKHLIEYHRKKKAKVTIGMIEVPWEETRHFGTGIIDKESRIIDWEEKPASARSNLASMGIYVFDKDYIVTMLKKTKEVDFGQHIIPIAIKDGDVFAYPFSGYWRDVGTVEAYWDAHMEFLSNDSPLSPERWRTWTNINAEEMPYDRPPIRIGHNGECSISAISPGCIIDGRVEHSVLSPGVIVEEGALVKDSVIMHDTVIKEGALVNRCIIDKGSVIGEHAVIGIGNREIPNSDFPKQLYSGLTIIGKWANVPANSRIGTNCIIYPAVNKEDFYSLSIPDGSTIRTDDER